MNAGSADIRHPQLPAAQQPVASSAGHIRKKKPIVRSGRWASTHAPEVGENRQLPEPWTIPDRLPYNNRVPRKTTGGRLAIRLRCQPAPHGRYHMAAKLPWQFCAPDAACSRRIHDVLERLGSRELHGFRRGNRDGLATRHGSRSGNSARFLNHACAPNYEAIETGDRVFIHALTDIAPGHELFIDYALIIDGELNDEVREQYACRCGTTGCRQPMLGAAGN